MTYETTYRCGRCDQDSGMFGGELLLRHALRCEKRSKSVSECCFADVNMGKTPRGENIIYCRNCEKVCREDLSHSITKSATQDL